MKVKSKRIKFSIGKKIILGFLAVVVIFSASTIYSYNTIKSLNMGYEKLINETTKSVILAENMKSDALEKVQCLSKFIISGDDKNLDMIAEYDISFNEKKYNLEQLLETDESKNALKALSNANSEYNNLIEEIRALLVNKEADKVMEVLNGKGSRILEDIVLSADTIVILAEGLLNEGNAEQSMNGQAIIINLLILTFITIIVSILLSLYISRVISKPVVKLSAGAEKIAEGDLTADDIHIRNKDEIGDLAKSFNKMLASLKTIAEKTTQSSYGVGSFCPGASWREVRPHLPHWKK
ncbi:MAG: HAMP domain-containing protein [Lutisporaceae bacterium]